MAYFKNGTKDIVLGVDIPTWVIDYEENENHIATLTKDEAILGAHLMWSVVKSSGPDAFDTIKPEYSRDSSFGKILVDLVKITGMNSPNEYDDTVKKLELSDSQKNMLVSCYSKIAIAITHDYTLKIVKEL